MEVPRIWLKTIRYWQLTNVISEIVVLKSNSDIYILAVLPLFHPGATLGRAFQVVTCSNLEILEKIVHNHYIAHFFLDLEQAKVASFLSFPFYFVHTEEVGQHWIFVFQHML